MPEFDTEAMGQTIGNAFQSNLLAGVAVAAVAAGLYCATAWRRVVEPNWVHIVQSQKKTKSYGSGQANGNVYYDIPSFVPVWGVQVRKLPISNFELEISKYEAYDKDRVPFIVDVTAFLRITDTNLAASRIETFEVLRTQLHKSIQNTVREVLGSFDIHEIMLQRTTLGAKFTESLEEELKEWGVQTVKNLALNDIRDVIPGKGPIADIMMIKTSHIEMESRTAVAENNRLAEEREILARQQVQIKDQEAQQAVGERTAQQIQAVGVAKERANQQIQQEAAITKQQEMNVVSVETQRRAEISKAAGITESEEEKERKRLAAEAALIEQEKAAEGVRVTAKGDAEATKLRGLAEAEATKAIGAATAEAQRLAELALVEPQLTLAEGIGENPSYQTYLVDIKKVEASQAIGIAQAKALETADVKVVATGGSGSQGLSSVGELISSKGGAHLTALLETLSTMPEGKALLDKLTAQPNS